MWCIFEPHPITTALRLQRAAERFATNEIPSGYLKQTGGEPMNSNDEEDDDSEYVTDWRGEQILREEAVLTSIDG